jgi:hypothetical protein
MVKWNLSLNPINQSQIRMLENLSVPFGFSLETESPHVEAPKKKEIIENVSLWLMVEIMGNGNLTKTAAFYDLPHYVPLHWQYPQPLHNCCHHPIPERLRWRSLQSQSMYICHHSVFEPFEDQTKSIMKYKVIYIAINLVGLGIIVYKLSNMGLLSLSPSAYIDLIPNYEGAQVTAKI